MEPNDCKKSVVLLQKQYRNCCGLLHNISKTNSLYRIDIHLILRY